MLLVTMLCVVTQGWTLCVPWPLVTPLACFAEKQQIPSFGNHKITVHLCRQPSKFPLLDL